MGWGGSATGGSLGLEDVGLRRPTLDDVFLALTGRSAEEDGRTDQEGGA